MKKRRLLLISLIMALAILALAACGSEKTKPLTSGDITEENITQVCDILRSAGLSNVDVFEKWVRSPASGDSGNDAQAFGFSDANCRMTVMLLAGDLIKYDSVEENYTGDYLMFDLDAIENNDTYSILRDKEKLFTTIFGEMSIPESGFDNALPDKWTKHGIQFQNDKCSIISIVFKSYGTEEAFVGHTGILIDSRDSASADTDYLFVEKIAFGDPFKITLVKNENELIDILSERADYTVEEGEPAPVVYKNDEQIGELKR